MTDPLGLAVVIAYIGLLISLVLALARLLIGPTLADRVVALDLTAFVTISFIAVYTIDTAEKAFLDIALTLALIAFLGTVAFARYILSLGQGAESDREDPPWKS